MLGGIIKVLVEFSNKLQESLSVDRNALNVLENTKALYVPTLNEVRAFLMQTLSAYKETEENTGSYQVLKKLDAYCTAQITKLNESIVRLDEKVKAQEAMLSLFNTCVENYKADESKLVKIVEEAKDDPSLLDPKKRAKLGKRPERVALLRAAKEKLGEVNV